ncbi:DUF1439 domain-containing protein [Janthinobacterium psychrotolerans]|uniref:DUF1439 domain-containing protein n=1 Tax=Janthinobacterium psychrotolerans TaxID=1747903 RepID=A0A1A7BW39_9BURK|nr:DUF1439 domain-containing protein [Janthinobacterium psychrotolerans]OBV37791.1 Protein of unknown function (DUF1439) [Janthinobacterium psychrotolerans]
MTATSKRCFLKTAAIAAAACTMLASCSTLIGPRDVTVSLAKMQQGLERRFPIDKRVLSLIDVRATNPQLSLQPERERVALSVDAAVTPPFLRQQWRGNLAMSGRLRLDVQRNAVYLFDASVDKLTIDGMDEAQQRQFAKVASLLADQLMHETPIYTFKPEDLRYAGVQFVPTLLRTTASGLVVSFEPVK